MLLPEGVSPCALPLTALVSSMRFPYAAPPLIERAASCLTPLRPAHRLQRRSARRGSFAPDSRSLPSMFGARGGKLSALVATFVAEFRVWQTAAAAVRDEHHRLQTLPH
jgi:hypothetical protein